MAADGPERPIRFGISLVPATEQLDRIRELVGVADEAGLDLVGIQDHPYQRHFLDTWSLMPATRRSDIWPANPLAGPPDWWVETLAGLVEDRFDTLVFWPVDTKAAQVEAFAAEVAPHFRRSS